jgi:hypothetical protein
MAGEEEASSPRREHQQKPALEEMLDDLQVYQQLIMWSDRLNWLSPRCWSVRASRALGLTAGLIRGLASAIYQSSLASSDRAPPGDLGTEEWSDSP